jgi:hypothetical protein
MSKIFSLLLYRILFFTVLYPNLGLASFDPEERVKVIFFLDRSTSMKEELQVIADLSDQITEQLESRCSRFSIAVSELEYGDIQSAPVGIVGYPAFITEEHPSPAEALKERILSNLPTESCTKPGGCVRTSAPHVGTEEFTYSSIVTTFQINRNQIFDEPIRHLSTFIVTDAAPLAEPYTVDQAIGHIESFIPLDRFSSTSLSHENWSNLFNAQCSMDLPDRSHWMTPYTMHDLQNLNRFSLSTNGYAFNICNGRTQSLRETLRVQIEDFINEVILKGCFLVS